MLFQNRFDAGRQLAVRLSHYDQSDAVVLALPRGGVPVGYEVSGVLGLPLDVLLSRKLGVPGRRELAMGAVASGGVRVLNKEVIAAFSVGHAAIENVTRVERRELERREAVYRGACEKRSLLGRTVILVDDGLATGASMRAAVLSVAHLKPLETVIAVPVVAPQANAEFSRMVDSFVCVAAPTGFQSVAEWYATFDQTTDEEVVRLLTAANARFAA